MTVKRQSHECAKKAGEPVGRLDGNDSDVNENKWSDGSGGITSKLCVIIISDFIELGSPTLSHAHGYRLGDKATNGFQPLHQPKTSQSFMIRSMKRIAAAHRTRSICSSKSLEGDMVTIAIKSGLMQLIDGCDEPWVQELESKR